VCRLESDQTTPQPVKQPVGVQPAVVGAVASAVRPRFLSGRRLAIPALLVCLASSFWLWGSYLTTRQSVAKLVGAEPAIVGAMASALRPRYLFSIYGVEEPFGLAVTPRGDRLYVAESGGERLVRVFDANGKQLQAFAPPDTLPQTRVPVYVALHRSGQVYVTDRFRRSLDVYDAGGNHKGSLAPPFAEGWQPLGVRVDVDSLVITEVTDGKHRVLKTDLQGKPILQYGQEGGTEDPGGLRFPNSAVVDSLGRIYVSDGNNARVQVLDRDGNLLYTIPGFGLPRGLEFDSYQRLHVVDTVNGEVRVFDASGVRPNLLFSFGGTGDDQLNYPNDIAIDDNDRVYIADRASNRVQVWVY
jgi:DNA-binding beta-propeller fold protein YncE